jgi:hypothetical protein
LRQIPQSSFACVRQLYRPHGPLRRVHTVERQSSRVEYPPLRARDGCFALGGGSEITADAAVGRTASGLPPSRGGSLRKSSPAIRLAYRIWLEMASRSRRIALAPAGNPSPGGCRKAPRGGRKTAPDGVPPEAVWLTGEEYGASFHSSDTLATSNVLRITSARPQT